MKEFKRYFSILLAAIALAMFILVAKSYWQKVFVGETVAPSNEATEAAKQAIKGGTVTPTGESRPAVETQVPGPTTETGTKSETSGQAKIPAKFLNKVTFLSQAPFGNWDEFHEEACEEASLIMLQYYLTGDKLNNDIGEAQIQKLIQFEIAHYGDYKDSSAAQVVQMARDFYGRNNLEVVYDFPKEEIKRELAKGNPVIIPAAGRLLGNPNFTPPGPIYHNLLLVGYDGDTIIANDPGTRKGEGYRYDINVLYNAIHDFPGSLDNILSGRKAMIVVR